jgi:hypothetical protein
LLAVAVAVVAQVLGQVEVLEVLLLVVEKEGYRTIMELLLLQILVVVAAVLV